jgi:hypothetical protein
VVLCVVNPVVLNTLVIELYAVPATVEYLHVAFSFVFREIAVEVVPAGNVPEGAPAERTGGVVSGTGLTVITTSSLA